MAKSEFDRLLQLAKDLGKSAEAGYRFTTIADRFHTLEEVQKGLRDAGLESSNLIVAVDFTGSNTQTGRVSFGGKCLHSLDGPKNPYQEVRAGQPFICGATLSLIR